MDLKAIALLLLAGSIVLMVLCLAAMTVTIVIGDWRRFKREERAEREQQAERLLYR
jgi:hypothetical protein